MFSAPQPTLPPGIPLWHREPTRTTPFRRGTANGTLKRRPLGSEEISVFNGQSVGLFCGTVLSPQRDAEMEKSSEQFFHDGTGKHGIKHARWSHDFVWAS